jgi:hypothetical protein
MKKSKSSFSGAGKCGLGMISHDGIFQFTNSPKFASTCLYGTSLISQFTYLNVWSTHIIFIIQTFWADFNSDFNS